jgi:hypothetical protein
MPQGGALSDCRMVHFSNAGSMPDQPMIHPAERGRNPPHPPTVQHLLVYHTLASFELGEASGHLDRSNLASQRKHFRNGLGYLILLRTPRKQNQKPRKQGQKITYRLLFRILMRNERRSRILLYCSILGRYLILLRNASPPGPLPILRILRPPCTHPLRAFPSPEMIWIPPVPTCLTGLLASRLAILLATVPLAITHPGIGVEHLLAMNTLTTNPTRF